VKASQRLDYANLAATLGQNNLVEPARLTLALQTSQKTALPFPELLISEGAVGDWQLSHAVCDLYGLPFLPVEIYPPNMKALEGLDHDFLREHRLIPLDRHGQILTVCMPALVPADVLGVLAAEADVTIMPVVGTVESNNRWLAQNLARQIDAPLPASDPTSAANWSSIFDAGNDAVLQGLTPDLEGNAQPAIEPLPPDEI
jgi:hypothetical protein